MTVENLHDAIGLLPSDLIAAVDEKRSRKPKRIPWRHYAAIAACLALVLGSSLFLTRIASGGSKETAMEMQDLLQAPEAAAPEAEAAAPMEAAPEAPAAIAGGSVTTETFAAAEKPREEDAACDYPTFETYAAEEIPPEDVTEPEWRGYPEFPAEDVQYADTRNIGTACTTSDPVIQVVRSSAELEAQRQKFGYCDLAAFDACTEIYTEEWFQTHDLLIVLAKGLSKDGSFSLTSITESDGDWCIRFYSGGPYSDEKTDRFVFAALGKGIIPEGCHLFAMFEVP